MDSKLKKAIVQIFNRKRSMHRIFFFFFLLSSLIAALPELTPQDVKKKTEEILQSHISYKSLTPFLMQRAIQNFLEELDPSKTYFLQKEVETWLNLSSDALEKAIKGFSSFDYSPFESIHRSFLKAMERRNELEQNLPEIFPSSLPPKEISPPKELDWALSSEELLERLKTIQEIQLQICQKFLEESSETFFQRIQKQRKNRETAILGSTLEERKKWIYTHILKAISSSLDANTNYFTPSETTQLLIQIQQKLFGIGAQFRDNLNGFLILRLLENSPASKEGKLKAGDLIIGVNQEPVIGLDITEVAEKIRGEKGTKVLLTILREAKYPSHPKEKLEVEIIRGEIILDESRLETFFEPFGEGILVTFRLFSFYQDKANSSSLDIRHRLEELQKQYKIEGIILDLRNNAGGLLTEAIAVAGLFMNPGVVASIKDHKGSIQPLRNTNPHKVWDGPLLILTNRASASAAEIVSQSLQDYGRAIVVGDIHTYGKGTYQTFTLDLSQKGKVNPKGEYKVTRGKYYTVSGKSPQLTGVQVDIEVPSLISYLDIGEEFTKYPLENDSIPSMFEDDLSDLPFFSRLEILPIYQPNLQKKLSLFTQFLPILKQNAQSRIQKNSLYQKTLHDLQEKKVESVWIQAFELSDLQWIESKNILKDLISLLQKEAALAS